MSISNINAVPYNTIQYIGGVPILSISYINGVQTIAPSSPFLFLGGNFNSYQTPPAVRIVKIQPNGLIDPTFITTGSSDNATSGLSGNALQADIQPDGKIIVTYEGLSYTGQSSFRVVRINQNGSRDTTYAIGTGFSNANARTLKCQTDFKTIFGGDFTTWSGASVPRIIRVNSSGSRDTTFNAGTGPNASVYGVDVQSDGKVVAVGTFSSYSGSTRNYITRINANGTVDNTFNIGTGFNSPSNVIKITGDGKILVGGDFQTYSGSVFGSNNRIVRINSDGTRDTTFNIGTGFNSTVSNLFLQNDSKILVIGAFTTYSGSTVNRIVRLNSDGTRDTTFNMGSGLNTWRSSTDAGGIGQASNGTIYVNGAFATYSGSMVNGIIGLNNDGTINNTFNTSGSTIGYSTTDISTNYGSFLVISGSSVITIGSFTSYRSIPTNGIISLTPSGNRSSQFNTGIGFNSPPFFSLDTQDGSILFSGFFTLYNNFTVNSGIIKLTSSGSRDTTFNPGTNNFTVYSGYLTGSQYVLAGNSSTYSGSAVNRIVRVNSNGTRDTTFNSGTGANNVIYTISSQSDGKIIAGGAFTSYSGSSNNNIVRINPDGTKDTTFNIGTGLNNPPYDLKIQSDQKIIVVGAFSTYSGSISGQDRIIRLNSNGTKDTTFNIGTGFNGSPAGIFLQSDGKIIVVGSFTTYRGSSSNRIVRINPDGTRDTTFNPGTGLSLTNFPNGQGNTFLSFAENGSFYLGGTMFSLYSGSAVGNIVKITSNGSIDPSFQTSGSEFNGFDTAVRTILYKI
jgi:uncharacterized delta-60 repeat protein